MRRRSRRRSTFGWSWSMRPSGRSPRYVARQVSTRMRSIAAASSAVARRTPISGVRVEPVGDPASVLDAMLRLAAAREIVVVLREPHEHGLLAEDLQGGEQLLGLLDRAAQVSLCVEDEERRLHAGHVGERRTEDELLAPTPRRGIPHLVLPEMPSDVARAERRTDVRHAALRYRRAEPIGVADDPVGHEPAVATPGEVEALPVDPAERERVIHAGHEVLVILSAPVANARFHEPLPVRVAPARVREKHRIPTPAEQMELVEERVSVRGVRPAVNLEHERPLLRGIEVARLHEPPFDLPAVRASELDALRSRDVPRTEELVVQACRFAHRAADLANDEIPRIGRRRDDRGEVT